MEVYLSRGRTLKYQITVCEQVPADSEIYQIEKGNAGDNKGNEIILSTCSATELLDDEFMQDNERKFAKLDGNTAIQVNDMSYHYGSLQCLEKVNIRIEKGKKYAVVGVSGSGKSTMLKILANLLNDYQGEVVFDEQCREKPIYLDQDTTILDGSILENVLFGQTCTNERLIQISQAIGLDEVVGRQPQNWGTEIAKGKNLSRGQEQRVCLARCLIKEADTYLLDEATSNIDVVDEDKIMKALLGIAGILGNLNPLFIGVLIIVVFLNAGFDAKFKKKNISLNLEKVQYERRGQYFTNIFSDFRYGKEIRANGIAEWFLNLYNTQLDAMQKFYEKIAHNNIISGLN